MATRKTKKEAVLKDHTDAVKILLDELINYKVIKSYDEINGVGHRVLHGGSTYFDSIIVDEAVFLVTGVSLTISSSVVLPFLVIWGI